MQAEHVECDSLHKHVRVTPSYQAFPTLIESIVRWHKRVSDPERMHIHRKATVQDTDKYIRTQD